MKNKRFEIPLLTQILKSVTVISIILSAVIGLGYYLALRDGFSFGIGHFDSSPWFHIFTLGIVTAAVLAAIFAFLCRGYGVELTGKPSILERCIMLLCFIVAALWPCRAFITRALVNREPLTTVQKLAGILTVFIVLAFLFAAFRSKKLATTTAIFFILAALAINFSIFVTYFDFSVPVNSPVRNVTTIMQCSVLLFMISEARFALPKESSRATAVFAAFVNIFTFTVCFGVSLAAILFGALHPNAADPNLPNEWLMFFFAVSVAAFSRITKLCLSLCDLPEEEE